MRRLLPIAALLAAALACDPMPEEDMTPNGVQVGSEGLIATCGLRTVSPDEVLPGFTTDAQSAADDVNGEFDATIADFGRGSFEVSTSTLQTAANPDCGRGLALSTTARLDASPSLGATLAGWIVLDSEQSGAMAVSTDTWAGDLQPTLDPSDYEDFVLRIDALLSDGTFDGSLGFEGCTDDVCEPDNLGAFYAE